MALRTLCMLLSAGALLAQTDWNKPFPAHKVIGNVYFVGTEQLATFLITTPAGHILINSDFETSVPVIRQSVESLGFKFTDIKIILGSHAHGDHMEGDALMKELTGAQVMALDRDVEALKAMKPGGKEHPIDKTLRDLDVVELGGVKLQAQLTAGHTKGCTTWTLKTTEGGKTYDVVIVCSVGVNQGYVLNNNKDYPEISSDYRRAFSRLRSLHADVFLGAHPNFYDMAAKYPKIAAGAPNPYIDDKALRAYVNRMEDAFTARFREQGGN